MREVNREVKKIPLRKVQNREKRCKERRERQEKERDKRRGRRAEKMERKRGRAAYLAEMLYTACNIVAHSPWSQEVSVQIILKQGQAGFSCLT